MKTAKVFSAVLLAFLFFASTAVFAQTEKGKIIVDVDFGLHLGATELDDDLDTEVDHSKFDTELFTGYMVIDNLLVAAVLKVESNSVDIENEYYKAKTSESLFMAGAHARYIFMPENKLRPYVGVTAMFGTDKEEAGEVETKHGIFHIGLDGGAIYWVNERFGIDGGYRLSKISHSSDDANAEDRTDMDSMQHSLTLGAIFSF